MTTTVPARAPRWTLTGRPWTVYALLAVPFVVMVGALRGMTVALPIFHNGDERAYHYPTILRFAAQLPFPNLHRYPAAQTPLFHLVMAYVGQVIGYEIWRLRLVEVLISYLLAVAVYVLLHRRLGMNDVQACALTLLFVLSPYVFGSAFRLLTDNLALLFAVLALERFERFREVDRLAPFVQACVAVAAAMLTRQSTAFLLGVGALYALRPGSSLSVRQRLVACGALAAAAVPVGLLFLSWHGLVPVGGDPSSCGLCSAGRAGADASALEMPSAELALAAIGFYGAVLFAPLLIMNRDRIPSDRRRRLAAIRGPLAAAGAGALLLAVFPASPGTHAAGLLWRVSGHFSSLLGSSLLFWVLVPLAGAVLWVRVARSPRRWLTCVFVLCFVVSAIVIRYPWQKYVDPFALLVVLVTVRPGELSSAAALSGAALLAVGFLAYSIDFSSHESATPAVPASPATAVVGARPRLELSSSTDRRPRHELRVATADGSGGDETDGRPGAHGEGNERGGRA